jgi:hypothetical protein
LEGTLKHDAGADLGLEGAPTVIREATDEYFEAQDIIKPLLRLNAGSVRITQF